MYLSLRSRIDLFHNRYYTTRRSSGGSSGGVGGNTRLAGAALSGRALQLRAQEPTLGHVLGARLALHRSEGAPTILSRDNTKA